MDAQNSVNAAGAESPPQIDGFEIIERLGQGGSASVWKARQISLQRFVVIKVLGEHFARDAADIKQFRLEARLAANLKHPGIVQVYDFGQSRDDSRYYFVMEYISGYSVGEWMRRKKILPENDALVVAHGVAAALRYAWDTSRIVHCDLKPDNIMVDGDGTVKLTDLGLAQVVSTIGHAAGRPDEFVTGTPNYMSPEQVRGDVKLDCRSDIYALGMTLYHMLTGKLPFAAAPAEVMEKQLHELLPHPQQVNPAISAAAAQLVTRMTAKLPADRHQSWDEVLAAIAAVEKRADGMAPAPDPSPAPPAAPAAEFVCCPHCNREIRESAAFCRHCGSQLQAAPKTPKPRLRVRPAAEHPQPPPPVAWSQARQAASRRLAKPGAGARGAPGARRRAAGWFSGMMGNVRLVLSVGLLGFFGYCGYQKVVNDKEIILPLRIKLQRSMAVAFRQAQIRVVEFFQRRPPADKPAGVPPPVIEETIAPAPPPVAPPPAYAPPTAALPPPPIAPAAAEQDQNREYERLLELCRQNLPRVGETVSINLQHHAGKREGTLQSIDRDGLVIKVESGLLTVPFNVMDREYRLRFFPEERARLLMQRAAQTKSSGE